MAAIPSTYEEKKGIMKNDDFIDKNKDWNKKTFIIKTKLY